MLARRRRPLAPALLLLAAVLAAPAAAEAAYTGAVAGTTATLTGDGAAGALTIGAEDGLLTHDLAGFADPTDFDSARAGIQSVPATGATALRVSAGGGGDQVRIAAAVADVSVDGGAGEDAVIIAAPVADLTVDGGTDADELTIAAPVATATVDGGPGADAITGGDGAERLLGGEDADTLDGGAGADRIRGGPGADVVRGGAGDDALLWRDGDGSDTLDGQDGADLVDVAGGEAADVFAVAPAGGRVRLERTTGGPFALDIGTAEALRLDARGGDDALTLASGTGLPPAVTAEGGAGADVLTGAEGADAFTGGPGADTLDGRGGADLVDGGAGADVLQARDGAADLVRCGADADTVQADAAGDAVGGDCETIHRSGRLTAAATIATRRATVRLRSRSPLARITVRCPTASAGGCAGTLTLTARVSAAGTRLSAVVGRARFALLVGRSSRLAVRLPRRLASMVGPRTRVLGVTAATRSRDAAGNVAETSVRVGLHLRR